MYVWLIDWSIVWRLNWYLNGFFPEFFRNLSSNDLRHLNASMLSGHLDKLKTLSFYDNAISCITSGTFDMLPQLQSLNLLNNPLHCNCHLAWFPEWAHQKRKDSSSFQLAGKPRCASPAALKDIPVQDVVGKELKCPVDDNVCSSSLFGPRAFQCPNKCSCSGTVVRCSRQKLKAFPVGIPPGTTELYVRDELLFKDQLTDWFIDWLLSSSNVSFDCSLDSVDWRMIDRKCSFFIYLLSIWMIDWLIGG